MGFLDFLTRKKEEEDKLKNQAPSFNIEFKKLLDFLPKPAPLKPPTLPSTYTVQPGDNLWDITKSTNGDPTLWPKLYQENKQIIGGNPDLILPKQNLDLIPILPKLSPGPRLDLLPRLKQPTFPPLQMRSAHDTVIEPKIEPDYKSAFIKSTLNSNIGKALTPIAEKIAGRKVDLSTFPEPTTFGEKAVSAGSDILADLPLWLGGDALLAKPLGALAKTAPIAKGIGLLPKAIPPALGTGVRAATTYGLPINALETALNKDGVEGFTERAKEAPLMGLGGVALHGSGQLIGKGIKSGVDYTKFNKLTKLPEIKSNPLEDIKNAYKAPSLRDAQAQALNQTFADTKNLMEPLRLKPLQKGIDDALGIKKPLLGELLQQRKLDAQSAFGGPRDIKKYSFTTGEQRAFQELQDGITEAQNYVRHTDVLAPYPPGTTIEAAYADIKANTGTDLPKLLSNWEKAQSAKTSLSPKELDFGRKAGVIPPLKTRELRPLGTSPFEAQTKRILPEPLPPQQWTNREGIAPGSAGPLPIRSINENNLGLLPKLQPLQPKNKLGPLLPTRSKAPDNLGPLLPQRGSSNRQGSEITSPRLFPLNQSQLPSVLRGIGKLKGGPSLPGKMSPLGNGQKARSFPISTAQSPFAEPLLIQGIKSEIGPGTRGAYDPITLSGVDKEAQQMIKQSPEAALNFVLNAKEPSALHTATGIRLIKHYQDAGNYEKAVDVSMDLADRLTKHGQAISAARLVGALSPDGILTFASRQINKINSSKLLKGIGKDVKLTPEMAQSLKELAERSTNAIDDNARIEASQELQALLNELKPSGIGRKLATTQTIAQLYNPKTQVRNVVGNELFYRLERLNRYPATLIDWTSSKLTGSERTVTFRTGGQDGYWDGFLKGAKAGWKGVNVNGLQTQYDLGRGPAFNKNGSAAEKTMSFLERSMGAVMKGFDNAAYQRAYNQTIGELEFLRAKKMGSNINLAQGSLIEKNLNDIADQYGKYVTFQDNNLISRALTGVKQALNKPTGGDFGLGDMVLKYPKTPGALIARGLDYSPAGFLRSAYLIAKPLLQGGLTDQREVVLSLSRAITGTTGLTGLGYFLADKGIITGDTTKDYDLRALQKQVGEGPFRVNISALRRWVFSGMDRNQASPRQGDTMVNYDWAQPIAIAISMGANMNEAVTERENPKATLGVLPTTIAGGLEGAANTIAEQPVLQGLSRLFRGYDMGSNITNTLKDIPGSFTPTLLNQIRQATDNNSRITSDQSPLKEAFNKSINKIPGLEKTLPQAFDTFGRPKEIYQNGSNNLVNVFLNPAFISNRNLTPESKMVLDIFNQTGETKQVPRVISDSFVLSGKKVMLTPVELSRFQQLVGEKTLRGFSLLNPGKQTDKLINDMVDILNKSTADAKATILKEKGIPFKKSGNTLKATN